MDYDLVRERLEKAYCRSPDAPSFLREILVLWSEHGLLEGEWCCSLTRAERTRSATFSSPGADPRNEAASATG
ncbi:MAG: hypothetical protein ACUVS1_06620 [Actinomycetota bacterium]